MSRRVRWLGRVTVLFWVVALLLMLVPVRSDYGGLRPTNAIRCRSPLHEAIKRDEPVCADRSMTRVATLAQWLVVTMALSTAYVAACARAGRGRDDDE